VFTSHTASEGREASERGRGKCPDTVTSELNGATWRDKISSATGRFRDIHRSSTGGRGGTSCRGGLASRA